MNDKETYALAIYRKLNDDEKDLFLKIVNSQESEQHLLNIINQSTKRLKRLVKLLTTNCLD